MVTLDQYLGTNIIKGFKENDFLEKAHKYLRREFKDGKYVYVYHDVKAKVEHDIHLDDHDEDNIVGYTAQSYLTVNKELLKDKPSPLADKISKSLNKLPDFEGVVYRGVSPWKEITSHIEEYKNLTGKILEFKSFTSTSKDPNVVKEFNMEMFFEIKSKKGKEIDHLSSIPNEKEVLFDKGTKFKVNKVKTVNYKDGMLKGKPKQLMVYLEEI